MTGLRVDPVDVGGQCGAWFTGRGQPASINTAPGDPANLAHRRPHRPDDLAAARRHVADIVGVDALDWHFMRQVHGGDVAVVDDGVAPGTELDGVDGAVTPVPGRVLVVLVADCVPVLFASAGQVGVAHVGRRGLTAGVTDHVLDTFPDLSGVTVVIGPSIRGCCYELPDELVAEIDADHPGVAGATTWGTSSIDIATGVANRARARGVARVIDGSSCTHCDAEQRWFSHRRDPSAGRFAGLVVLRPGA